VARLAIEFGFNESEESIRLFPLLTTLERDGFRYDRRTSHSSVRSFSIGHHGGRGLLCYVPLRYSRANEMFIQPEERKPPVCGAIAFSARILGIVALLPR
jgi:hypothetical protein